MQLLITHFIISNKQLQWGTKFQRLQSSRDLYETVLHSHNECNTMPMSKGVTQIQVTKIRVVLIFLYFQLGLWKKKWPVLFQISTISFHLKAGIEALIK